MPLGEILWNLRLLVIDIVFDTGAVAGLWAIGKPLFVFSLALIADIIVVINIGVSLAAETDGLYYLFYFT
ncbi:hypothetical protein BHU62_21430 [Serratia marcescens]|uniref:Uncharacterized protein n=1 Tax=Serratia marcescens TaxID=615 RepID=A0A1Q4NV03_SERMA|nr:hypothetical protein BHU62_21430 [Serratia marcescens]